MLLIILLPAVLQMILAFLKGLALQLLHLEEGAEARDSARDQTTAKHYFVAEGRVLPPRGR